MRSTDKRLVTMGGGLLAGVGFGSCLAWSLHIFEIAHPQMTATCSNPNGCNDTSLTSLYPSMGLTVFLVLIFSSAFGFGLGLVASSLIRPDDVRQGVAAALEEQRILGARAQS